MAAWRRREDEGEVLCRAAGLMTTAAVLDEMRVELHEKN